MVHWRGYRHAFLLVEAMEEQPIYLEVLCAEGGRRDQLDELKHSIMTNGYVPVERVIVVPYAPKSGFFLVVEGNRSGQSRKFCERCRLYLRTRLFWSGGPSIVRSLARLDTTLPILPATMRTYRPSVWRRHVCLWADREGRLRTPEATKASDETMKPARSREMRVVVQKQPAARTSAVP